MKQLIFLIAAFTFCNCQIKAFINESEIEALGIQCNAQRNDIDAVKNLMIPTSETGQCFMLCALGNMLTPSGTLDANKATTLLQLHYSLIGDPNIIATIVNTCVQSMANYYNMRNTCLYGYLIAKCGHDQINQYGLLPSVRINADGSRSYMQTKIPNILYQ